MKHLDQAAIARVQRACAKKHKKLPLYIRKAQSKLSKS